MIQMAHFTPSGNTLGDVIIFENVGKIQDNEEFKDYNSDTDWELRGIYTLELIEGKETLPGSIET